MIPNYSIPLWDIYTVQSVNVPQFVPNKIKEKK